MVKVKTKSKEEESMLGVGRVQEDAHSSGDIAAQVSEARMSGS